MQLRPYQQEAVKAAYSAMKSPDPFLIVLPTGAGKSAVIATMALEVVNRWRGRVVILSHVKELISQVSETIKRIDYRAPVGIYSAGMGSKNGREAITVAGIQSAYKNAHEIGPVNLILVDECHLIPMGGDGMYQRFLRDMRVLNPDVRLTGLTATDYRMGLGRIHGEGKLFSSVCYEAKVRDLIEQGYLSKLRGKHVSEPDLTGVHLRGGEYIAAELNTVMEDAEKVKCAVKEIIHYGQDRKGWLVFCCSVEHANMVVDEFKSQGERADLIIGDTESSERDDLIAKYKAKEIKTLVSVGVLTTGFDAPHIDLIALLRPTKSPGLYYQMVGRGLRKAEGKNDCLVLDMAGCIFEHGPIDELEIREKKKSAGEGGAAPVKACPQCQEILNASAIMCNYCGHEMPREKAKHEATAYHASPLVEIKKAQHAVKEMIWNVHNKKNDPDAPKTIRVTYVIDLVTYFSEWVCIEHSGFARNKAEDWWYAFYKSPCPFDKSVEAFDFMERNPPPTPTHIAVETGGKFPTVTEKIFAEENDLTDQDEPTYQAPRPQTVTSDDEVPF